MDKEFELLKEQASELAVTKRINEFVKYGHVGAALITDKGNIYTGVAITCAGQIGMCAERNAISDMLTHNETKIRKIVAMNSNTVVPPCGICREFIRMVDKDNMETEILISETKVVKLKDLLPHAWTLDTFNK